MPDPHLPTGTHPSGAYFRRLGEHTFVATPLTGGAWTTSEQHISPLNGLIVHVLEQFVGERGLDDLSVTRISVDILGVIGYDPFDIAVHVVRPGRTIELLEVIVTANGRAAVRARVWRAAETDTSAIAGGPVEPLPDPEGLAPYDLTTVWRGGYINSIEVRFVGEPEPGRATAWVSTPYPLLATEPAGGLATLVGLVDTANGLCAREDPDVWLFPNLDLTIHLLRRPRWRWLGFDTTVTFGPTGQGITSSVLHDLDGHVGYAQQTLTLRRAPGS